MKIYERKSFPRTARDLKVMYEKTNLSFDNAVQRSFVWKNTAKDNRMSMLIDSMMRGFPIPPMYCNCIFEDVKNKKYDFLDGKQRTTTIVKFLKDEFPLVNIPTFEDEDGNENDFNGLTFSQLPEDIQDIIKTYSLTIYYYENMDQEDAEEMFRRLNNGKSLTAIELTRANAVSGEKIRKIAGHDLFKNALSERSLASYANEDVVIKTWILLYSDKKSFETRNVRPILKDTVITDDKEKEIVSIFDTMMIVYEELKDDKKIVKKLFNKNNLIALASVIKKVNDEKIETEKLINWIINFYETDTSDMSKNEEYNEIIKGRVAVTENAVITREEILINSFGEFINGLEV